MPVDLVDVSRPLEALHTAIGVDGPIPLDVTVIRDAPCAPEPSRTSS